MSLQHFVFLCFRKNYIEIVISHNFNIGTTSIPSVLLPNKVLIYSGMIYRLFLKWLDRIFKKPSSKEQFLHQWDITVYYQHRSCGLGRTCSSRLYWLMVKVSTGGLGWVEKCLVIPAGKDSTISPAIFTKHLPHTVRHERRLSTVSSNSTKCDPNSIGDFRMCSVAYLVGSAPLKQALMVSVKAAATGRVSWGPIVRGLGPLEHTKIQTQI